MACLHGDGIVLCTTTVAEWTIRRGYCRYCREKTLWYGTFADWYGWTIYCLGCGGEKYGRRSRVASRRSERVAMLIGIIDTMNTQMNKYHGEVGEDSK